MKKLDIISFVTFQKSKLLKIGDTSEREKM